MFLAPKREEHKVKAKDRKDVLQNYDFVLKKYQNPKICHSFVDNFSDVDPFCFKLFEPEDETGIRFKCTVDYFEKQLHKSFADNPETKKLHDGYAPFCKHLFVPNFIGAKLPCIKITEENKHVLVSGYISRRPEELPVLARWFPKDIMKGKLSTAKFLDVILYSREQIIIENNDMGQPEANKKENASIPWGIVGIKPQDQDFEIPMQPITMIRNELGTEYGGSGQKINKEQYLKSVEFWNEHAEVY